MNTLADMTIYDRNGQLALIVEVKNKFGTNPEWAAKMRRNILAHGILPDVPFFLLAFPDQFYLWKNKGVLPELLEPDYQVDPIPFLKPFYDGAGLEPQSISGAGFDIIVSFWFNAIIQTDSPPDLPKSNKIWLVDSGLFKLLQRGRIEAEVSL